MSALFTLSVNWSLSSTGKSEIGVLYGFIPCKIAFPSSIYRYISSEREISVNNIANWKTIEKMSINGKILRVFVFKVCLKARIEQR